MSGAFKKVGLCLTLAEGIVLGTCVKMFTITGPAIVCGLSASVIYGLLLWAFGVV